MLRSSILVFLALFIVLTLFSFVGAVDVKPDLCDTNSDPIVCQIDSSQSSTDNTLVGSDGIITRIAQALVWASGALAAILIIVSGLMFIFSSGNPESAGRARRTLLYAVVGVIVAVAGQAIVTFVLEKL